MQMEIHPNDDNNMNKELPQNINEHNEVSETITVEKIRTSDDHIPQNNQLKDYKNQIEYL